jgi:uncharacterized membrane protein YGL010W
MIVFDNDDGRNVVFMSMLRWNAASISMKTRSATKGHCVYIIGYCVYIIGHCVYTKPHFLAFNKLPWPLSLFLPLNIYVELCSF